MASGLAEHDARGEPIARVRGFGSARGPVDLDVHVGDIVLLRGANGSGKTSLLRSLAGLPSSIRPTSVVVRGRSPADVPAPMLAREVMFALQDPAETLTGLTVAGEFRLRGRRAPVEMADLSERDVANLSSGEARRVSTAVVSGARAPLLLLDEPMEGLDAAGRRALLGLVAAQATTGAAVVADHSGSVAQVATRIVDLGAVATVTPTPMPTPSGPAILLAPATVVERGGRAIVLPAVRLSAGFHVVRGPNACGKSTLLLHLAGLLGPGAVIEGAPAVPGNNTCLLLPRAADLFAHDNVAAELRGTKTLAAEFVPAALLARHPLSLSAGEAQRVALAKCLGRRSPVYLLDEPEGHLDGAGRAWLFRAIAERNREGACVLAASHDEDVLSRAQSTLTMGGA